MTNLSPTFQIKWLLANGDAKEIAAYIKQDYNFVSHPEVKLIPFKRGGLLVMFTTNCMETVKELRVLRAELSNKYKFRFL
jgi:hypothetical protein